LRGGVFMSHTGEIIRGILGILVVAGLVGWFVVKTVKAAEDPARMVFKWVFTAVVLCFLIWVVFPMVLSASAMYALPLAAVCMVAMIVTWRHDLAGLVANPFAALYDGGNDPPDPHPFYSVARARQKQGRYLEAVEEIRKQLGRFPTDVEGQLLLAEVQAENLKDLAAAELTIEHFCEQAGHAPQNITFALYSMADWHLQVGQDRPAAQRWLEKVIQLLPDTEYALGAAQRIAHLSTAERLLAPHERRKFIVVEGPRNLGLLRRPTPPKAVGGDPEQMAAEYVRHLEQYPLDMEARERLAVIYTDHYGRLDLATEELEQMIEQPNQPGRLVVHWLNLLADLQIRSGADYETVRQTLQRIIDRDPKMAAAEIARNRLALVKLELKANEKKTAVPLGSYAQNLGLKQGPPRGLYGESGGPKLPRARG